MTSTVGLARSLLLCVFALLALGASPSRAQHDPELYGIARDAYVYAYPIVTMDVTMRQMTNVAKPGEVTMRAPVNQLAHVRTYPGADDRTVVRVNFDTLYSSAWIDVSREPVILSVPAMGDRYYLFPMLDMWTDVFAVPGTRTTGNEAGRFAIVGPGWSGTLPEGVTRIDAPTSLVWTIGRTQTNGPADFANVNAIQDRYTLTPLSQWGKEAKPAVGKVDPAVDGATEPLKQVNALSGVAMLTRLAELMKRYPPHPNDYPILWRMEKLGLEPGRSFDAAKLDPARVALIEDAAKDARATIAQAIRDGSVGVKAHGWSTSIDGLGAYGTSYRRRAMTAMGGLGANLPEDAVYPRSATDVGGEPYHGENRYRLRFEKDELPPVDAFWSLTLYDSSGFQVPNALNRFAIGDRDPLQYGDDGSLEIYIEHESPGADKESNWLPCPEGPFNLVMRLYSPRFEVLDGKWSAPGVVKMTRGHPKRNR